MTTNPACIKINFAIQQNTKYLESLGLDKDPEISAWLETMEKTQEMIRGRAELLLAPPPPLLSISTDSFNHVFHSLSMKEIFNCSLVCKKINEIVNTDVVCTTLYFRCFPNYPKPAISGHEAFKLSRSKDKLLNFCATETALTNDGGSFSVVGRTVFVHEHKQNMLRKCNLDTKACHVIGYLCPKGSFNVSNDTVYMISSGEICIVNPKNGDILEVINHESPGTYTSTFLLNNIIYAANLEARSILRWDLDSKKQLSNLQEGPEISCFLGFGNNLYSGRANGMILISNVNNITKPPQMLSASQSRVCSLAAFEGTFCSAHEDGSLKFWDLAKGECLQTFQEYCSSIIAFQGKLYTFTPNSLLNPEGPYVKVWDEKGTCLQTLKQNTNDISDFTTHDGKLFSRSAHAIQEWGFTSRYLGLIDIVNLFREKVEDKKEESIKKAMEKFSELSVDEKNEIYGQLYKILAPFEKDYLGCAQHAFYGEDGQESTPEQRAQAVEAYATKDIRS